MIGKYVEQLVRILIDRGFEISTIRESYLEMLRTEKDYEEILNFINRNPKASYEDINYEIHKIYLRKKGIML